MFAEIYRPEMDWRVAPLLLLAALVFSAAVIVADANCGD
jgi:hypothetical protein